MTTTADRPAGHRIDLDAPATAFIETFLLGNGRLGAAVHGVPGSERVDLNTDTFWSGGPTDGVATLDPEPSAWLAPVREAVRLGRHADAERLTEHLRSTAYSQAYQPYGALVWDYSDDAGAGVDVTDYRRSLALDVAETTTRFRSGTAAVTTSAFVSAVDDVLVLEVETTGGDRAFHPERLRLDSPHPGVTARTEDAPHEVVTWAGRAPIVSLPLYLGDVPDPIVYADDRPDADGTVPAGMGFAVAALVQRTGSGSARVVVAAEDGFRGRTARPSADLDALRARATTRVTAVAATSTAELRDRHREDHRRWYDAASLSIGSTGAAHADGTQVERFFNLGRYLLIASSRVGTQPANLQGIWNDEVRPGWSCNHTTNINIEMNYWSAASTGLGELTEPFTTFVGDLVPSGSRTAETFYGLAGWTVHHNTDVWAFSAPVSGFSPDSAHHANWPAGAAWLVNQVVDIDRRSPVPDETIDAVLDGAARFALGWLEPDSDGLLATSPSTSPEHDFVVDGVVSSVSSGSAMDQQLVQELLQNVLERSDDTELVTAARSALGRLRPPVIGPDGTLLEWAEPWEPLDRGHRHLSHLVGLYPGRSIDRDATPALYRAAAAALRDRVDHGSGHTGWSQAWIGTLAAHVGDRHLVAHSIDVLVDELTSASMLDLHPVPDHPTGFRFQIDGNLGGTAAVVEALVQSADERVRLLRAVPDAWLSGSIRGVRVSGGHAVDVSWDAHGLVEASVEAVGDGALLVEFPGTATTDHAAARVTPTTVDGRLGTVVAWEAVGGDRLHLRR